MEKTGNGWMFIHTQESTCTLNWYVQTQNKTKKISGICPFILRNGAHDDTIHHTTWSNYNRSTSHVTQEINIGLGGSAV